MQDRPWFKFYDPGVPHTLEPYPDLTLLDVVDETVRRRPEQRLLIFKGASLTYGEVARLSDALAAALVAQGVQKGSRLATLLPNCPQMVIVQLAAWKLGCIVAPMNPLYTERELEQLLNEVGATTLVVLTPFYHKVKSLQAAHESPPDHRHQHKGIHPRSSACPLHASQGEKGRPPDHAAAGRLLVGRSPASIRRPGR